TAPPTSPFYTLSLHDALPISAVRDGSRRPDRYVSAERFFEPRRAGGDIPRRGGTRLNAGPGAGRGRRCDWLFACGWRCTLTPPKIGRAHVELQSRGHLVCRLL